MVVVTLFVNPSQFDEQADLERYPRDEDRDALLAARAGADILFAPSAREVYPDGFATTVAVAGVSEPLEGEWRGAAHFRGVATVVTKLLCMALPDVAYFGRKDAQQLLVIRRLVADLNLPVRIASVATVREPDGLALSSRNRLPQRRAARAGARHPARARRACASAPRAGERSAAALLECAREVLAEHGLETEYVALVDPDSLAPLSELDGDGLLLIAARVGGVRLIDNEIVGPRARQSIHEDEVATAVLLRAASTSVRIGVPHVKPPRHQNTRRPGAAADDAAAAGREEASRRTDRDGHRLRLPERPCRRGRGRGPGAGRRLGRHHRARLHRHDARSS